MTNKYRVAIFGGDSEDFSPAAITDILKDQNFDAKAYKVFGRLVNAIHSNNLDCVLVAAEIPDIVDCTSELRNLFPVIPIIALAASVPGVNAIIEIFKNGISDVLTITETADIPGIIKAHIRRYRLWKRVHRGIAPPRPFSQPPFLCGVSDAIRKVRDTLSVAQQSTAPVIIRGPAGCMAEDIARIIHDGSGLDEFSEITLASGRMQRDQLFGGNGKTGILHALDTTISIYPAEDMTVETQAMVMRLWQNGMFSHQRLRLIFIYTVTLEKLLAEGKLLPAFYNEMSRLSIIVPPLEDRREDIPHISYGYLQHFSEIHGKYFVDFSLPAMEQVYQYVWPGDIAELRDEIDRIVHHFDAPKVISEMLSSSIRVSVENAAPVLNGIADVSQENTLRPLSDVVAEYLEHALQLYDGNVEKTAKALGIGRATLYRKIERHGLRRDEV